MQLSLIVAMAENRVIGKDNQLPWKLSGDLQKFKQTTMGHHLAMGRKTFDSIGRPLPGRTSLILTRSPKENKKNELYFPSIPELINHARELGEQELFIIGGAKIYEQMLPMANRLYLTRVHALVDGDAFFPKLEWNNWQQINREDFKHDQNNEYDWSFEVWQRQ